MSHQFCLAEWYSEKDVVDSHWFSSFLWVLILDVKIFPLRYIHIKYMSLHVVCSQHYN